jgi:hypothetical protein
VADFREDVGLFPVVMEKIVGMVSSFFLAVLEAL